MRAHPLSRSALTPFTSTVETKEAAGVTAPDLRASNLSTALRHILTYPRETSRAAIAASTGSTRATVSRLVDELIAAGIVTESEATASSARGRPAKKLSPTPCRIAALGLEISVDTLKAHVIDLDGNTLAKAHAHRTKEESPQNTFHTLKALAQSVLNSLNNLPITLVGSGLALPGIISDTGLSSAPNLGWRNISRAEIHSLLGNEAPRFIANEADLAAYRVAHPLPGVLSEAVSFIYVSGEVGIGAGIVLDHRQIIGTHGWAGEIGHICVDPQGEQCGCGSTGCLETYLGRKALARRAGMNEASTPIEVLQSAQEGNLRAQQALSDGAHALGRTLATVVNLIDIQDIILGGNLAELAEVLIVPCREELTKFSPQARLNKLEIRIVKNSSDYSVEGAAHRVLDDFVQRVAFYL